MFTIIIKGVMYMNNKLIFKVYILYFISVIQTITIAIYSYSNFITILYTALMLFALTSITFIKYKAGDKNE